MTGCNQFYTAFLAALICSVFLSGNALHAYIEAPYSATFQTIRQPVFAPSDRSWNDGEIEVIAALSWVNVWSIQDERFLIDGEELQMIGRLTWAPADTIRIGIKVPYKSQGGGIADSMIERFHAMTGVTQGQRDRFPRNKFNVSYEPLGSIYPYLLGLENFIQTVNRQRTYPRSQFDPPIAGFFDPLTPTLFGFDPGIIPEDTFISGNDRSGFGELTGSIEYALKTNTIAKNIILAVQATGSGSSRLYPGNAGQILTGSVMASTEDLFFPWRFSASVSYSVFDRREFRLLALPQNQWTSRISIHRTYENWSPFFEYAFFSTPIQQMGRLNEPGHQFAIGASYKFESSVMDFAFIENFLTYATTPDAGLFISLRYQIH